MPNRLWLWFLWHRACNLNKARKTFKLNYIIKHLSKNSSHLISWASSVLHKIPYQTYDEYFNINLKCASKQAACRLAAVAHTWVAGRAESEGTETSGPAYTCWVRICTLKAEQGIPTLMNSLGQPLHCEFLLSFLTSPSPISHWQMEILIPSSVCTWSIWPERGPGNNGYYYLMNSRLCASPHMAPDCYSLPRKADKALASARQQGFWAASCGWGFHRSRQPIWLEQSQPMLGLPLLQMKLWGPGSALKHNSVS